MKYFLIILLILSIFCGSCTNSLSKKSTKEKIDKKIFQQIEEDKIDINQYLMTEKFLIFFGPLILAIFISIIILFLGSKILGLAILTSASSCIFLLITLVMYTKIIGIIGIILFILGIFILGKKLYDTKIFERDMVQTVEIVKPYLTFDAKTKVKETLKKVQSKNTQKIVKQLKK